MLKPLETLFHTNRIFIFLVVFRWASLIPALWALDRVSPTDTLTPLMVLGIAVLVNAAISIFNRRLNEIVLEFPAALGTDLLFSAFILYVSGGLHSPYYLYALSPLLAAAFFFQLRGALLGSLLFTPLYLLNIFLHPPANPDTILQITQLAGIWLFPLLFAYPSTLLRDITRAREELSSARDELAQKHENRPTSSRCRNAYLALSPQTLAFQKPSSQRLTRRWRKSEAGLSTLPIHPSRKQNLCRLSLRTAR